ncbi:PREDICTED: LOW QUALITY PROTEIN: receptor-type tyrosine-protein phosphatase O [Propithecus coquereli]|uniref:LOW QUALITY PROTEIN: receptor-type tyrosine-protein phosphatase O n=1 Tax=Propithecus coquereli TaxID=379532 RepID=UPI00063F9007|nr:PREDICTED: LOW QUALITY PROTEIN: receptor-type tyrosine-protein phosphatase O [Propithecus coquereli]
MSLGSETAAPGTFLEDPGRRRGKGAGAGGGLERQHAPARSNLGAPRLRLQPPFAIVSRRRGNPLLQLSPTLRVPVGAAMGHLPTRTRGGRRLLPLLWLFVLLKDTTTFHVTVQDDNNIVVSLEASDVVSPASVYVVKITGESKNYFFEFEEFNSTLPPPVIFKANYHGLYYIITLVVVNGNVVSKPSRSITVLTKPLPVTSVSIYDYKPSPETGVLFEIHYPEKYNVFTRVNISYWEGKDFRTMLYKGKWQKEGRINDDCYSLQSFSRMVLFLTLKKFSIYYNYLKMKILFLTAPYPPQNISVRIVNLNKNNWEEQSGSFPEESFMRSQDTIGKDKVFHFTEETSEIPSGNISSGWAEFNSSDYGTTSQPYWWDSASATPESEDEFVSVLPTEYNNTLSGMEKSTSASFSFLPVQMILSWLPPKPPTAFDGFHIRIEREENFTEYLTVDEEAHEFVAELKEPGKYKLSVTTFSSSGACETRKSQSAKSLSFYISPSGEWIEELTEKPQHVSVHVLSSTTALMSWTSSQENYNSTIVSVVSLTCQKQKESQRLEKQYCTQVNSSKPIIENLVPGAQYQVVMYLRKGPLIGPPSDPVTFAIVPTGIKDLMLYPLGPTAVVLSWTRPYLGVFRKYVVEMFYFNPSTMTSEWTTYYEIAATVSLTASVRIANLLPAWYYNFRVTMVTWGDPELSCCDSSTISFITAPVAPEITSVEYFNSLLYISWTYGDDTTDLSHSRMLHWMVVAEGKKKIKKSVTRNVMTAILSLPPGDIYNLSVTACTERGSNTSMLRLVKLGKKSAQVADIFFGQVEYKLYDLHFLRECGAGTFVNFASLERDGKLPYNWRRSIFAFLTLLPSCLWTDYLLAFYINPWSKNGLKKRKLTNPVQLDDFDAYIKDMAKDSDYKFSLQFEELKLIGLDIPHFAADLPLNRCKNRYTNILPYDFSRVRLVSMNEEEGADYINANYIPGYNSPQEYIATQGPLPETRNDFWKMVLQQKSHIIVMLTQCNEKRRVKCDHYWPFTEEPIAYGDITVEMISEEEQDDWACRHFRINYADEMQDVMHFNYTAWPDHGVPTANAAESILQFVYMVRQQATKSKGPMIIHCSAGVGRTGTFIALDRLLQHIRDHEFVDILGLVSEMRSYRMSMVQTEEQYIFIHQCVQLMWMKKKQQFCISDVIYENVTKS